GIRDATVTGVQTCALPISYLALKRYPESIASLEQAVRVDPKHVGARFNLVNAYARAGRMKEAEKQQAVYADLSGHSKAQKEKDRSEERRVGQEGRGGGWGV